MESNAFSIVTRKTRCSLAHLHSRSHRRPSFCIPLSPTSFLLPSTPEHPASDRARRPSNVAYPSVSRLESSQSARRVATVNAPVSHRTYPPAVGTERDSERESTKRRIDASAHHQRPHLSPPVRSRIFAYSHSRPRVFTSSCHRTTRPRVHVCTRASSLPSPRLAEFSSRNASIRSYVLRVPIRYPSTYVRTSRMSRAVHEARAVGGDVDVCCRAAVR
ncbi:hypothetical protein C8Q70DRAFT_439423 [Cubamyces menziesii]|nr:hypothetical protein C8Q70DRAFT_439423 [Cubamyces menziesii]